MTVRARGNRSTHNSDVKILTRTYSVREKADEEQIGELSSADCRLTVRLVMSPDVVISTQSATETVAIGAPAGLGEHSNTFSRNRFLFW